VVGESFRSLSATHLPRAHDIGAAFHFTVCSRGSLASFRHPSSLNESMNRCVTSAFNRSLAHMPYKSDRKWCSA
jgi:hypothetical protein